MREPISFPMPETPVLSNGDTRLTAAQVAEVSGHSVRTLADYRSSRGRRFGPPFHKEGRKVFYLQSEVITWLEGGA